MKNLTLVFLCWTSIVTAQPKLVFDSTVVNFGIILEGTNLYESIGFQNTGNEPLLINRASTGDGGSYADYPKDPIAPGQRGAIHFKYDTKRVGKFNRTIYVFSNAGSNYLTVKGEVIYRPTTITVPNTLVDLGNISYGTLKQATFSITNSGTEKLYLNFDAYHYKQQDIFAYSFSDPLEKQLYSHVYSPSEVATVSFTIRNIYGNTGRFERKLKIAYNSKDSVILTIKGNFVGVPCENLIYERNRILRYKNGELESIEELNWKGFPERKLLFRKSEYIGTE